MKTACMPKAPPRIVSRTESRYPGTFFSSFVKDVAERASKKVADWPQYVQRSREYLQHIGMQNADELVQRLIDEELLRKAGDDALAATVSKKVDLEDIAPKLAAIKVWYQSAGGGLQDLATAFLRKHQSGEDALDVGLQFAHQARAMAKMGDFITQTDRKMGRGLLIQKFQDSEFADWASKRFNIKPNDLKASAIEESQDTLTKIADLLNGGSKESLDEGVKELVKFAELIRLYKSPEHAARAANKLHNVGNMIWTIAINGLLSSPRTWVVNAASVTHSLSRPIFQLVAAKTWEQLGMGYGRKGARMAAAMASAEIAGQYQAFQDAWRLGWGTVRDGRALYGGNWDVSQAMDMFQGGINAGNINSMTGGRVPSSWHQAIDGFGKVMTMPGSMLQGSDDFIKHIAIRGQVRAQAMRRAIEAEGFDVLGDQRKMADYFSREEGMAFDWANPDFRNRFHLKNTYDQHARVMGEAKYVTFQEDNELAQGISKLLETPVIGPLMRPFVPFVRTPLNIMKQGFIDSTPLGLLLKNGEVAGAEGWVEMLKVQKNIVARMDQDPAGFYRHVGQVSAMTVLAGAVYGMVMSGQMTGGGPRRWDNRRGKWDVDPTFIEMRRSQGFSTGRYEIKLPGGGVMAIDRLGEPFAMPLKMIADIGEMSGYMTSTEQDEMMSLAVYTMVSGLFQGTFVEGMNNLFEAVFSEDPDGRAKFKAAQGAASVYMPMSGMLGYLSQVDNPYREQLHSKTLQDAFWGGLPGAWEALTERVRSRMPGQGNFPVQRDPVFGEPVPIYPGFGRENADILRLTIPFLPTGRSQQDDLYAQIFRLTGSYVPRGSRDVKLTPAEVQRLNEIQGKEVFINGKSKAQALREYLQRPEVQEYMQKPFGANLKIKSKIETDFYKIDKMFYDVALDRMTLENPSLQRREILSRAKKIAQKRDESETIQQIDKEMEALYQMARMGQSRTPLGLPAGAPQR